MLPIRCSQPPCMNIADRSVIHTGARSTRTLAMSSVSSEPALSVSP